MRLYHVLERVSGRKWVYLPTEDILPLGDVIERFSDSLSEGFQSPYSTEKEPEWLKELKESIHIRLIGSQRLLNFAPKGSSRKYRGTPSRLSTVSSYSDELAKHMQDKFKEYGATSQSLDGTFPLRVVKQKLSGDVTDEQLRQQLNELEVTRSRLIEVGLLDKEEDHDPWQVCCGHDLVKILSLGLRKAIGSNKATDVEPNSLERNLRLAYEEIYFQDTKLYALIRTWESKHQPFRVLPIIQNQ